MTELGPYLDKVRKLNPNKSGGKVSPHKMCMLLAVIDLFDAHPYRPNRIEYEPQLLDRFHAFFRTVSAPGDHPKPYLPFFHLKTEGFWHLYPLEGREEVLAGLSAARKARDILDNVHHVSLDDELYQLLRDPDARNTLAESIVEYWFDRSASELRKMLELGRSINRYEESLRSLEPVAGIEEAPPQYIRDPAFRRVVLEAYDYRCAATGTRIILPDESVMVQAAHIEPFSVAGNDDPRNGLALTPDMHWAMDKQIIAPGPDYKWHVSRQLDRRMPENEPLTRLDKTKLILPREQRLWPKEEFLARRQESLL